MVTKPPTVPSSTPERERERERAIAMAMMMTTLSPKPLSSASLLFVNKPTIYSKLLSSSLIRKFNHHSHRIIVFSSSSSSRNNSNSEIECPVPVEQQPVKEYESLSKSFPFSWACADFVEYCSRLAVAGASFALFVGLPVACFGGATATGGEGGPVNSCVLGAVSSGLFVVTLAVLHMYLGWSYVGNRLLSATVEYEETGWYDGQLWVKTAEVLARDRLLGSFSVKPVLSRLKYTLLGLGASLFICILLLINIEGTQKDSYISSEEAGGRAVPGVYNDDSARSFEPDAFCGEPGLL